MESIHPDKYSPKVVKQTGDYLYAEFESPTFGVSLPYTQLLPLLLRLLW